MTAGNTTMHDIATCFIDLSEELMACGLEFLLFRYISIYASIYVDLIWILCVYKHMGACVSACICVGTSCHQTASLPREADGGVGSASLCSRDTLPLSRCLFCRTVAAAHTHKPLTGPLCWSFAHLFVPAGVSPPCVSDDVEVK